MPLNRAWLCFSPKTEFREQYLAYGTLWGIGAEGQHFGVCAEWVCEGTSRTNGSLVSWAGETWSLTHRKDYQGKCIISIFSSSSQTFWFWCVISNRFHRFISIHLHFLSREAYHYDHLLWPIQGFVQNIPRPLDWTEIWGTRRPSQTPHTAVDSAWLEMASMTSGLVILTTSPVDGQDVVSDRWTRVYGNHTCRPTWACTHALD